MTSPAWETSCRRRFPSPERFADVNGMTALPRHCADSAKGWCHCETRDSWGFWAGFSCAATDTPPFFVDPSGGGGDELPSGAPIPRRATSPRPGCMQLPATVDTCDRRHILAIASRPNRTSRSTDDVQEETVAEYPTPVVPGSAVGIIPNPMSGRDIRRVVAQASVFPNAEKTC
jgi:hypothetical protein